MVGTIYPITYETSSATPTPGRQAGEQQNTTYAQAEGSVIDNLAPRGQYTSAIDVTTTQEAPSEVYGATEERPLPQSPGREQRWGWHRRQ
jgi:hypothetical protein